MKKVQILNRYNYGFRVLDLLWFYIQLGENGNQQQWIST